MTTRNKQALKKLLGLSLTSLILSGSTYAGGCMSRSGIGDGGSRPESGHHSTEGLVKRMKDRHEKTKKVGDKVLDVVIGQMAPNMKEKEKHSFIEAIDDTLDMLF